MSFWWRVSAKCTFVCTGGCLRRDVLPEKLQDFRILILTSCNLVINIHVKENSFFHIFPSLFLPVIFPFSFFLHFLPFSFPFSLFPFSLFFPFPFPFLSFPSFLFFPFFLPDFWCPEGRRGKSSPCPPPPPFGYAPGRKYEFKLVLCIFYYGTIVKALI